MRKENFPKEANSSLRLEHMIKSYIVFHLEWSKSLLNNTFCLLFGQNDLF